MSPQKQPSLSMLFHPKKKAVHETKQGPAYKRSVAEKRPRQPPVVEEEDEGSKLPDGPYQEFRLLSSALNGWKYDVMKFDSRKPVDFATWSLPIKLNRKELRPDDGQSDGSHAVKPMLGLDGKPVIGADGKIVMVDSEGRPIPPSGGSVSLDQDRGKVVANGKKRFMKKTRQVFKVPEEVRLLRKEERYPWVLEDSSPNHSEVWIGQMDDVARSETHAFFMPAANDVFKFVPAHRWYKFQKKLKHNLATVTPDVDAFNARQDLQAWLARRNGRGQSPAMAAMFKAERGAMGPLVINSSQSLGPGGRRLKTVDRGSNRAFDDDGDSSARRRREKEYGGEGDLDEQVYEEDFADDEEKMDADDNDEEAKALEERLKREYKTANKQHDAGVDESEEEESPATSKQTKAMQKLIRSRENNDAYETDEEKNPYASSEEEEEDPIVPTVPAIQQQPQQRPATPKPTPPPHSQPNGTEGSRASSPVNAGGLGGHSVVAKRATSPSVPRPPKPAGISGGDRPLRSQPTSTNDSRAASPVATRAESATNGLSKLKRKADDGPGATPAASPLANGVPRAKKRKAQGPAIVVSAAELEALLVEWLKTTPKASTRDCIHHFTPYLTDADRKTEFSGLVRKVAQLKNGVLVLRHTGSAASSPIPAPPPAR